MSNEIPIPENLSIKELCQFTGLKAATFHKAISQKTGLAADLPYVKLGRRVIYRRQDVFDWIERHLVRPEAC